MCAALADEAMPPPRGYTAPVHRVTLDNLLEYERDWAKWVQDGSGSVTLDNYKYDTIGVTFATLEIHWRDVEYPLDETGAIAFAHSLAEAGLHHQDPDTPLMDLTAKTVSFQDRPAWLVLGQGTEFYVAKSAAAYPIEWLIFHCPGSDWLWSLVISADHEVHMNHLRSVQRGFECPPVEGSN